MMATEPVERRVVRVHGAAGAQEFAVAMHDKLGVDDAMFGVALGRHRLDLWRQAQHLRPEARFRRAALGGSAKLLN